LEMSPEPDNPLTDAHLGQLNNALDIIKRAKVAIDRAKRIGLDVSQAEATNQANEDKIRLIKQVYFSGR
jgi:hypothetical protein